MTAAGDDRIGRHAGARTEVEHALPGQRDRALVDEELGEGPVDEARTSHPPGGRLRIPVTDGAHDVVRSARRITAR